MKGLSSGIKVGITAIAIAVMGYLAFKFVGKGIKGEEGYMVFAHFRDATGLVDKSRVQVAGLIIGEIKGRRLDGNLARVDVRIKGDVDLWSNASIFKKSASLLGEFYLEIDPGTPESLDPLTRQMVANYKLRDCDKATGRAGCNQIANVIEAVTISDVLVQLTETVPVLRDILKDVQKLTQGPLQDITTEVKSGIQRNSMAAEKLLTHIDEIAGDVKHITGGTATEDFRRSMENVRDITEQVKKLVGSGEGQVNTAAGKIQDNLDRLAETLDKLNHNLDNVGQVTDDVAKGKGNIGRLLKDETIADTVTEATEDVGSFLKSLTRLQTIIGIREEYNILSNSFKTYLSLKLMPKPDKYYLIEVVDDPRGNKVFNHNYTYTNDPQKSGDPSKSVGINTDSWTRTPAFKITFMFAKRVELWRAVGITGRLGIKESTGGLGLDFDFWNQRVQLQLDLFDFASERYPRLKALASVEFFKHLWLVAGVDDIINDASAALRPAGIDCGDQRGGNLSATPRTWCQGGRDFFVGLQLTFNDEDLRAILAVGGSALAGAGR